MPKVKYKDNPKNFGLDNGSKSGLETRQVPCVYLALIRSNKSVCKVDSNLVDSPD